MHAILWRLKEQNACIIRWLNWRSLSSYSLTYTHTHTISLSLTHTHTYTHFISLSHTYVHTLDITHIHYISVCAIFLIRLPRLLSPLFFIPTSQRCFNTNFGRLKKPLTPCLSSISVEQKVTFCWILNFEWSHPYNKTEILGKLLASPTS